MRRRELNTAISIFFQNDRTCFSKAAAAAGGPPRAPGAKPGVPEAGRGDQVWPLSHIHATNMGVIFFVLLLRYCFVDMNAHLLALCLYRMKGSLPWWK